MQAAILLAKLTVFAEEIAARVDVAKQYTQLLESHVITPFIAPGNTSVYAQYTIRIPNRDQLQVHLQNQNIPTAIHYPIPVNKQPVLTSLCGQQTYPIAETCSREVLSLPMHPYLTREQISYIAENIVNFVEEGDRSSIAIPDKAHSVM